MSNIFVAKISVKSTMPVWWGSRGDIQPKPDDSSKFSRRCSYMRMPELFLAQVNLQLLTACQVEQRKHAAMLASVLGAGQAILSTQFSHISFWSLRCFEQVYQNKFYTEKMLAALFEVFLTNMMKLMWLPRKVCHKWSALPRKFSLVYPRMLGSILGCLGNYPRSSSSKTLGKWCLPKQVKKWKHETNC